MRKNWSNCKGAFLFLGGMGEVWYIHVEYYVSSLTCDVFDQHELLYRFILSLAWEGFGQHKLTLILYSRCHGIGLVNIS